MEVVVMCASTTLADNANVSVALNAREFDVALVRSLALFQTNILPADRIGGHRRIRPPLSTDDILLSFREAGLKWTVYVRVNCDGFTFLKEPVIVFCHT